jgi:hypothetical protein
MSPEDGESMFLRNVSIFRAVEFMCELYYHIYTHFFFKIKKPVLW